MTPAAPAHKSTGNPRRGAANSGRTLETHALFVRTQTQTIERLGRRAGPGSRGRMNEALRKAQAILQESIDTDGAFVESQRQHDTQAPERDGLDTYA